MATVTKKSTDHETNTRSTAASRVILVVAEDNRFQDTLVEILREEGYSILAVTSTASAHDALHKTPPSLVVLDSMISDGMDFCRWLRSSGEMAHVPILMIVPNEREGMYLESQGIRVDDAILKPLHREELQACVRTLLRRRRPQQEAETFKTAESLEGDRIQESS